MGRIKSLTIKRAADNLFESMPGVFTEDFERNKKALVDTMPSKPVRNKVAGQLVRLAKQAKAKAQ